MKIVDLNVLLYVVNEDAPHHERVVAWWEGALNGDETIGLPWSVVSGFLRVSTHRRVFPRPLSVEDAVRQIDDWLALGEVAGGMNRVIVNRYRDYVLEALSTNGRLVASRRFDRVQDVAVGLTADFWVRTGDDPLQTLTIVEPILVRRQE